MDKALFNKEAFFDCIRKNPFPNKLTQAQVSNIEHLLRSFNRELPQGDKRWAAYMLATTFHETAYTMEPITEYGSQAYLKGKKYYPFIGRGFCQLTWEDNYKKADKVTGENISGELDLALQPDLAAQIILSGMIDGWFTGKAFKHYFNATTDDPVNARRIINGTDCAAKIADYHKAFLKAIKVGLGE